ncbi:hypothetical protein J2Z62_000110 [Mycoplasmoides fastidiosum]|uniref:Aspartyl/glutamyl-tRNA amidotransferase subunit C n=1 Tax=Mycoplasmoides fastidiosum TaxID=92758 RepID=A0ABU0LY86_9BACT|nr:ECF transporter S component [Mycoplasmoides fastidiosum]MDQ0513672.1 hypothetical protein [Mycoplasmoides fastidiosum]UUD37909.1 hypothetical protein NPA10_00735 [Mycoplasmoides fastidiosum]
MNNHVDAGGPPIGPTQAILIFLGFVGLIFVLSLIKKIWYRIVLKKQYYIIPRTQIKGITNIAMVISMSVAIIFTLTVLSANSLGVLFRVYVGSRITIESILIRIGGILFGPLLGLIIGALTDLLTVILTSGIFHYGYFVAAMSYGFLAGLVKTFMIYSQNKNFNFAVICTSLIGFLIALTLVGFQFLTSNFQIESIVSFTFLSQNMMKWILVGSCVFIVFLIWVLYPLSKYKVTSRKNQPKFINLAKYGKINVNMVGHNTSERNWYMIFIASLTINLISQISVDIFLLPIFDITTSTFPYNQWLILRFLLALPMLVFNTAIVFLVASTILPIIKYDYVQDMIEDLRVVNYS